MTALLAPLDLLTAPYPSDALPAYDETLLPIGDLLRLDYTDRISWEKFSHEKFLTDHDHAAWLARFNDLVNRLRVVNLERPWTVGRSGQNPWRTYCDLCDNRTSHRTKKAAETAAVTHAHVAHGWSAR